MGSSIRCGLRRRNTASLDSSDNAKLKSAEILGKYYSLFDDAFGDEAWRSSGDLLQELEQLLVALK